MSARSSMLDRGALVERTLMSSSILAAVDWPGEGAVQREKRGGPRRRWCGCNACQLDATRVHSSLASLVCLPIRHFNRYRNYSRARPRWLRWTDGESPLPWLDRHRSAVPQTRATRFRSRIRSPALRDRTRLVLSIRSTILRDLDSRDRGQRTKLLAGDKASCSPCDSRSLSSATSALAPWTSEVAQQPPATARRPTDFGKEARDGVFSPSPA